MASPNTAQNPEEFLTPTLDGRDAVRAYFEEIRAGSATWTVEGGRATRFQAFLEPQRAFGMLAR